MSSADAPQGVVGEPQPRELVIDSKQFDGFSSRLYREKEVEKYGGDIAASFSIFDKTKGNAHFLLTKHGQLLNITEAIGAGSLPSDFVDRYFIGMVNGHDADERFFKRTIDNIRFVPSDSFKSLFDKTPQPGGMVVPVSIKL